MSKIMYKRIKRRKIVDRGDAMQAVWDEAFAGYLVTVVKDYPTKKSGALDTTRPFYFVDVYDPFKREGGEIHA